MSSCEIFISEFNDDKSREIVVEGDKNSIYAYILKPVEKGSFLDFDGFICSCGVIVENSSQVKENIDKSLSSPLMIEYKNEFSIQKGVKDSDISIEWNKSFATIKLNGIVFLVMDIEKKISYSKGISKRGAYGFPLSEYLIKETKD